MTAGGDVVDGRGRQRGRDCPCSVSWRFLIALRGQRPSASHAWPVRYIAEFLGCPGAADFFLGYGLKSGLYKKYKAIILQVLIGQP